MTTPKISPPVRLDVALAERGYPIFIGSGLIEQAGIQAMDSLGKVSHAFCVSDRSVAATHGKRVNEELIRVGLRVSSVEIPSGEGSKSIEQLGVIWQRMLEERCDRSSVVVAIGGGVIGDLAGFAAATFARGLRLIQVPTTLLSQVDSSVGGKTGINLPQAKNIVGAFWQPSLVLIDLSTLQTLPVREYLSGLAEVVKYGVIMDASFFGWIEQNVKGILERNVDSLSYLIRRSCECKGEVVAKDERETTGLRAILNYGHTFAHALEAATKYGQLLHGEAVSIGMTMAAKLAHQMGRVSKEFVDRQTGLLTALKLPTDWKSENPSHLWKLMQSDKKVHHGQLSFILPSELGRVETVSGVEESAVLKAIME